MCQCGTIFSNIFFAIVRKWLLLLRNLIRMQVPTYCLGGPCLKQCWMATCFQFAFRWPWFLGMSACIVSKPCTDTLNVFINTIDNSWMQLTHLFQVIWYWDICLFLCNICNFLQHLSYQHRLCPLLSPVTGLKISITIAYEYIPKWQMNPTTIWRHDGGLKFCEIKSVVNSGRCRIYPWLIISYQPPNETQFTLVETWMHHQDIDNISSVKNRF